MKVLGLIYSRLEIPPPQKKKELGLLIPYNNFIVKSQQRVCKSFLCSFSYILISIVCGWYGLSSPDMVSLFLRPIGLLIAEPIPSLYTTMKYKQKNGQKFNNTFFSPGFTRNGLLLLYTVAGCFISMAFNRFK